MTSIQPAETVAALPPAELIPHLLDTHHVYTREAIARLTSLLNKVADVHGQNHRELEELCDVWGNFAADMLHHLEKEERVLFPAILAQSEGRPSPLPFSIEHPIRAMEGDHETAHRDLDRMRELTGDYQPPEDACGSYQRLYAGMRELDADVRAHVRKEEDLLFPKALAA